MGISERYEQLRERLTGGIGGLAVAGQLDAGLTSAATFLVQLYAVRVLDTAALGVLALTFSAMNLAYQAPARLVFTPVEILAVEHPAAQRMAFMKQSLTRGVPIGVLAALFVGLGAWPLIDATSRDVFVALVVTAALMAVVSPIQDHVRRMLHLADDSWRAARTSLLHFATTIVAAFAFHQIGPAWVPFGSLVVANLVSSAYGFYPALSIPRIALRATHVYNVGRWMLAIGVSAAASTYVVSLIIGTISTAATLGHVEAARLLARPLQVLSLGLVAVTGPRSMESGQQVDLPTAKIWRRRYSMLLFSVAAPYVVLAALPASINPLAALVPRAFEVPWLVIALLVANVLPLVRLPRESELLGARKTPFVAGVSFASLLVRAVVALSAVLVGEFAAPLALIAGGMLELFMYKRGLAKHYPADLSATEAETPPRHGDHPEIDGVATPEEPDRPD